MLPKPSSYYGAVARPTVPPNSRAAVDDGDDGCAVYALTAFLGLYLLITVLLLRGAYFLARQLPARKASGASPAPPSLRLDAASLD